MRCPRRLSARSVRAGLRTAGRSCPARSPLTSKNTRGHAPSHGNRIMRRHVRRLASPRVRKNPLAAATIGSAGIILRSSTACSVTRYLPRTASFMHCAASILRAWLRRIVWWGSPGQRGRGTYLPGVAAVVTVTERADEAGSAEEASAARITGSALSQASHEQVVFCHDGPTGLRAIIAIYSTALGPSLGGTRFYPYPSQDAAIADVLNLSRAMAYKNALAGLDHGGGKAVIIGDPEVMKSEALLRAYGRFVQSLNGRYITACDVGTYSQDMDVVARECRHVTGRTEPHGGAGDSSVLTAFGVFQGMRAAAEHTWGSPSLASRAVAVEGVGKVGSHLVDHLVSDGARVRVYDVSAEAVQRVRATHPEVTVAASLAELIAGDIDVYAPCALGGVVDDELEGFNFERARAKAEQIFGTTKRILALAGQDGVPPAAAADRLAERRMSEVGRLRGIWLGG